MSEPVSTLESNKAAVRRFKESQGTRDQAAAMREILAPGYTRLRGGMVNLANNARDQGFPGPGAVPARRLSRSRRCHRGHHCGGRPRRDAVAAYGYAQRQPVRHSADRTQGRYPRDRIVPAGRRQDHGRLVHGRRAGPAQAARRATAAAQGRSIDRAAGDRCRRGRRRRREAADGETARDAAGPQQGQGRALEVVVRAEGRPGQFRAATLGLAAPARLRR